MVLLVALRVATLRINVEPWTPRLPRAAVTLRLPLAVTLLRGVPLAATLPQAAPHRAGTLPQAVLVGTLPQAVRLKAILPQVALAVILPPVALPRDTLHLAGRRAATPRGRRT